MEADQIMKRQFVLGMLSLALAGCAQSKGALSRGASYPPSPVAVTPVPSIYDTVNQGVGGKKVAQTAIGNPDDPQWSGRAQVATAARPVPPGAPNPPGGPSGAPLPSPSSAAGAAIASRPPQSSVPPAVVSPAMAASAVHPSTSPPEGGPVPDALAPSPALAGQAAPAPLAEAPTGLVAAPASGPRNVSSAPGATDAGGIPLGSSSGSSKPAASSAALVAADPAASSAPTSAEAPAPPSRAPTRGTDPLLGPNPDVMPPMTDLPPIKSTARQLPAPGELPSAAPAPISARQTGPSGEPPALELAPTSAPSSGPPASPAEPPAAGPAAVGVPASGDQPIPLDKSTAVSKPASAGLLSVGLPLEVAPQSSQVMPATAARTAAPTPKSLRSDPNVVLASAHEPAKATIDRKNVAKQSGRPMARVGDEIISFHDLKLATDENLRKEPALYAAIKGHGPRPFDSAERMQLRRAVDMAARQTLAALIDRSLLVQDAKRHIKDKKMLDRVFEEADRIWHDDEIIPLQRQYAVDSEQKLKEKLAEEGRSLDAMHQSYQRAFLAENYLRERLRDRMKIELPDLLRYYNDPVHGHEFDRPAQITWRELVVEVDQHKSREGALKKANDLWEKLRRGADFAKLARAESDGPTSSRRDGGLMHTTPGSYAVKSINDALGSLPIGQVSKVIEGPDSFHIIKVENRRAAGPASFEEVQDQIGPILLKERFRQETTAFIAKLQKDTPVSLYDFSADEQATPSR
jgi:peptidyl-prolyl cis-trans isomerase SurA